jgi:5'-3' exonuclease
MKILGDCNNIGFNAYYSTGELSVGDIRTGVVFGFLRTIFSIADRFETSQFIFCWDSRQSFRKKFYPEYKAKRKEREKKLTPEQVTGLQHARRQFVELRQYVLPHMGFGNITRRVGYEGDDLIAAAVMQNREDEFCILSSDNDLYQLLGYNVFMFNNVTKKKMTAKRLRLEYGVSYKKWALAKAIGGCTGDDVEGIRGAADPRNNPRSKALQYIKGELTKGLVYARIESAEGKKIIARNKVLVELPFKNGKNKLIMKINKRDKFKKAKWLEVFASYDFRYFMQSEQMERLEELFGL